jgi:predicted HAD superfamily Cof-like phosphohydrolase
MSLKKFPEPNGLSDVAEFHDMFSMPVLADPIIPASKRCELRVNLLREELKELEEAIQDNNIIEIADALADLQYVLSGAILEFGLAPKFKEIFDDVHSSNMSKTCVSMEEALETQKYYEDEKETESFIEEKNGQFLVYRKYDKKVLKSINYRPAHISEIING